MEAVFLKLLNMSITASWLVLAIVVLRFILKKSPRVLFCVLWALVGLRLVCPFSFESVLSLIPSPDPVPSDIVYSQTPQIHSGIPLINNTVNPIISENFAPNVAQSVNPTEIITFVASIIWAVGVAGMMLYTIISFLQLRKKVQESVLLKDNIFICDHIPSPFILGIFRPKIYLPSSMNDEDMQFVIAHENAHIKRGDHFWKPLGFALLSVYWFNPVLWVAYIFLCRDIELACDEKVIKNMGAESKKPYSTALINCSVNRKMISACPLAFGEVGVKGRIKTVLNYKKPAFWISIVAIIASLVVSACFLTNPLKRQDVTQLKNGSDLEGVSIEIASSKFESIDPYIEIEWKNKTDKDIMFGEEFYIKRNSEDCRIQQHTYNDNEYKVEAKNSKAKKYYLNGITMTYPVEYRFLTYFNTGDKSKSQRKKVWIDFKLDASLSDKIYAYTFKPIEQIYQDPLVSHFIDVNSLPQYKITSDMHLVGLPDIKSEIEDYGQLTEFTLNEINFDTAFFPYSYTVNEDMIKQLRHENKRAWFIDGGGVFNYYIVLEQKDGAFYILICVDSETEFYSAGYSVRGMYRLEKRRCVPQHNRSDFNYYVEPVHELRLDEANIINLYDYIELGRLKKLEKELEWKPLNNKRRPFIFNGNICVNKKVIYFNYKKRILCYNNYYCNMTDEIKLLIKRVQNG